MEQELSPLTSPETDRMKTLRFLAETSPQTNRVGYLTLPPPSPPPSPEKYALQTMALRNVNNLNNTVITSKLCDNVATMTEGSQRTNTKKAYDPKIKEYEEFCDKVHGDDKYKYMLTETKVLQFMYYLSYRDQKKRGRRKKSDPKANEKFDLEIFNTLMEEARAGIVPNPKRPIAWQTFGVYKAVFRNIHASQVAKYGQAGGVPGFEFIWTKSVQDIHQHVIKRRPLVKKMNHDEKIPSSFEPYQLVEKYEEIEQELWQSSDVTSDVTCTRVRSVHTQLKHRYCMLHLTTGLLRSESAFLAEMSDFTGIFAPKRDSRDAHQIYIMVNVIPEGKTNSVQPIYGRAIRHKNVKLCCIGALSFYLTYRIHNTGEFANMTTDQWADNSYWFDIKLLTDIQNMDNKTKIQNDSFGKRIKEISHKLNISVSKNLHLGRNLGSRTLDFLELDEGEIRRMGQWNPSTFDNSYSSKIPMKAMRKLAGYTNDSDIYFNTRTTVEPNDELLRKTPIGSWVYDTYAEFARQFHRSERPTAHNVLQFFIDLNRIFLQDAAAMLVADPERINHPMYDQIPVLSSNEFVAYTEKMREALDTKVNPIDADLERVLPGVKQWHSAQQSVLERHVRETGDNFEKVFQFVERLGERIEERMDCTSEVMVDHIATSLVQFSHTLRRGTKRALADGLNAGDCGLSATDLAEPSPSKRPCREEHRAEDDEQCPPITMARKYESLRHIWDEWHGTGCCSNDTAGGVGGRDKKYGKAWRKRFKIDGSKYSRNRRLVDMVLRRAEGRVESGQSNSIRGAVDHILEEMEPTFRDKGCCTQQMVVHCQDVLKYIEKKKARGKTAGKNHDKNQTKPNETERNDTEPIPQVPINLQYTPDALKNLEMQSL